MQLIKAWDARSLKYQATDKYKNIIKTKIILIPGQIIKFSPFNGEHQPGK